MKITIQNTTKLVHVGGTETRVWEGTTEKGIPVTLFVASVAVQKDVDLSEFEKELKEQPVPNPIEVWPARMIF